MTFNANEIAASSGPEVHLFAFEIGPLNFYYTNHTTSVVDDGITYSPIPGISCSEIEEDVTADSTDIEIRLPFDALIADIVLQSNLGEILYFRVKRGYVETSEFIRRYDGYMVAKKMELPYFVIVGDRNFGNIIRPSATACISSNCTVPLYGHQCKVNKADFKQSVEIDTIVGLTITLKATTVTTKNYYAGGFIEFIDGKGLLNQIDIDTSDNLTLICTYRPIGLQDNAAIDIYPGCNHLWEGDCLNKFNNTINCTAFPFINSRNPFSGSRVF